MTSSNAKCQPVIESGDLSFAGKQAFSFRSREICGLMQKDDRSHAAEMDAQVI